MPSNWVEGGICQGPGDYSIIYGADQADLECRPLQKYTVYTDTVSQYIGLRDKNGKRIFEGDYLTIAGTNRPGMPGTVYWNSLYCTFVIQRKGYSSIPLDMDESDKYEVVGNRWDNPELLGDSEKKEANNNASI